MNYVGINITKYLKELHVDSYKFSIVKMSIFPNLMNRFNAIPNKSQEAIYGYPHK